MDEVVLAGPRRLSDFVALLRRAPTLAEADRLRAEGVRAILDMRQAGDDLTPLDPDALAAALMARDMVYIRLALSRAEPLDNTAFDRFGAMLKSLPKPMVVVSPVDDLGGLFAVAQVAIEQGTPGEAMLDTARALGVLYGETNTHREVAACVDAAERRPDRLEKRARLESAGAPDPDPMHQRAVVMHAEAAAIGHPLRSAMNELPVQIAAGVSAVGLVGALLVDRRLLILSLAGMGYLSARAWPLIATPVAVARNAVVPGSEIERLRETLDRLKGG